MIGLIRWILMGGAAEARTLLDPDKLRAAKSSAAKALGRIGGHRATEALLAAWSLGQDVCNVKHEIADALVDIGNRRAIEALTATLFHDARSNCALRRYSAAEALAKLGSKGIAILLEYLRAKLNDCSDCICVPIVTIMGKYKVREAVNPLLSLLDSPAHAHATILPGKIGLALAQIGVPGDPSVVMPLAEKLKTAQNYSEQIDLISALTTFRNPRALWALVEVCKKPGLDEEVATRAVAAIRQAAWSGVKLTKEELEAVAGLPRVFYRCCQECMDGTNEWVSIEVDCSDVRQWASKELAAPRKRKRF
jgi:HEAT repeat protein